jgi:hypothetical protein
MLKAVSNASIVAAVSTFKKVNKPGQSEESRLKRGLKSLEICHIALIFYR